MLIKARSIVVNRKTAIKIIDAISLFHNNETFKSFSFLVIWSLLVGLQATNIDSFIHPFDDSLRGDSLVAKSTISLILSLTTWLLFTGNLFKHPKHNKRYDHNKLLSNLFASNC